MDDQHQNRPPASPPPPPRRGDMPHVSHVSHGPHGGVPLAPAHDATAHGRPPLDDFIGYLDGTLDGARRVQFEHYLSRNREARRRLKQLARLDEKLQEGLVIESLLADARSALPGSGAASGSGSEYAFDETLVAAWVDGALTREERAELQRRLADPKVAVEFYRQASTARRAQAGLDAVAEPPPDETREMPAVRPRRSSGVRVTGAAADGSASAWLGRLLIHSSADSVWVLDASPTGGDRPAVSEPERGRFEVRLPFDGLDLCIGIRHAYRGVELAVSAQALQPPADAQAVKAAQFVLTDEAGRRLHRTDTDTAEPATLPPLRPGVYRLMAPPLPLNVLVCVNGEMGTTEIHQLLGRR